ncbi:DNA primase [Patescibacteria group bacterium]|nr:DNA primase [Patescibacteria group bacterium]MCG2687503.1 DNA primase [Candidatus Parcubacteria bacterium]
MLDPKDEIKQRLDVVEIVAEYLQLKNAGSGGFKACCPFHSEKTPSFYVSKEKQIWHCFGCNKGGDLLSFIMEMEGIDFPQALEIAAKKAGVTLPDRRAPENMEQRDVLLDMHVVAQKLFAKILFDHNRAKEARDYLNKRGISQSDCEKFGLGFALEEWSMLVEFFKKRGYKDSLIIDSGLAKKRQVGDGLIDRFRNRIMIPLYDAQGHVVGFTGRALQETENSGPKYLNSSETLIYNKRSILYGLHLAKVEIRKKKSVIIVEGNLDVIASHKAGVENIVASSGTALTELQLQILKKLTNTLIFCLDGDNAGYEAAKRGIDLALSLGFNVKVISIPKELGKDTDDVVRKDPKAWQTLVSHPIGIMEFYFAKEFENTDTTDIAKIDEITKFLLSKIELCSGIVEREHWLMHLADRTRVDISSLRLKLKEHVRVDKIENSEEQKPKIFTKKSKQQIAIEFFIGLFLTQTNEYFNLLSLVNVSDISDENLKTIVKDVQLLYNDGKFASNTQNTIFSTLRDNYSKEGKIQLIQLIDKLVLQTESYLEEINEKQVREEIESNKQLLIQVPQKLQLLEFERKIRQAEMSGEKELARTLSNEYAQVLASLKHDN